jgi:membrane protease YdiL (CAAX protease family)
MGDTLMTNETATTITSVNAEKSARPFPGIWASIGWIVLFFVLQLVGAVVAIATVIVQRTLAGEDMAAVDPAKLMESIGGVPIIWSLVGSSLLTLFFLWLYLRRKGRAAAIHLDQWSQLSLKTTLLMAVGFIGFALAFNWAYTEYVIPGVEMQQSLRRLFESIPKTLANNVMLFVTIAILAPLTEELLFRGLLQKSLSHRMPQIAAVLVAAAVFAAIHFDLYAFPALFVMGAVFGYLYYRTGSLKVSILLHMINNGAALILSWIFPS